MNELRQRIALLPEPEGNGFWAGKCRELREYIAGYDPDTFLTWSPIITTMFVGEAPYIRDEYETLMADDRVRWMRATREDAVGAPDRLSFDQYTSGNLVHQAYHLAMWEFVTGYSVERLQGIIEIGGGYGAMAKVVRQAGFTGTYCLIDTPEFTLLQRFYLERCGIAAELFSTEELAHHSHFDLLIGLYSLSEMDEARCKDYLDKVTADHYLLAANGEGPLGQLAGHLTQLRRFDVEHIPGSYYLLG